LTKFAIIFTLLIYGSCANTSFSSSTVDRRISPDNVALLAVGEADLTICLDILGAPTHVEQSENGAEFILSYEWWRLGGWKVGVSVPISKAVNSSINFTSTNNTPSFVKLIFNGDWRLIKVMQG
jgi:hypothetical protein